MGCNSQVGKLLQALIRYHYSFGYLSCQYSIWVFMETLPIEKKHGMCLQINRKGKLKKKKKIREEKDGTKDSGTYFLQRGSFFIFELGF